MAIFKIEGKLKGRQYKLMELELLGMLEDSESRVEWSVKKL